MKRVLVLLLIAGIADSAIGQNTISDLPNINASAIDNDTEILFGVDDSGDSTSKKLQLRELKVAMSESAADVSSLLSLEDPVDGHVYKTLGYTSAGVGGARYYYDEDGTQSINGGTVLPGFGGTVSFTSEGVFDGTSGTGRFLLLIPNRIITAENFGADGTGSTVATEPFQRFLDFIETNEEYVYRALGRYKIDDTLRLENARWFNLQIGQSGAAKNRGVKMTGLLYDGTGGTTDSPANCKPALVLYRCSDFNMPVLSIWQDNDGTEEVNTTGLLVHGGDSSQRGYCTVGEIAIVGFGRGLVMGLGNAAEGTYRDVGSYNDDVFENWNVSNIRITGCKRSMYVDAFTSDGSRIDNLFLGNYRPDIVDPSFGPTQEILEVEQCGNWSVGNLQVVQSQMGVSSIIVPVADVSTGAETFTFTSHGLVDDDIVHLESTSNSGTVATGLSTATMYYVVSSTANTFQLAAEQGGSAIDLTAAPSDDMLVIKLDGNESAIKCNAPGSWTIEKGNLESHFCRLLTSTGGSDSRNGITIANFSCIQGAHDIDYVAIDCASALRLNDSHLAGWVDVDLQAFSGSGNWFFDPGFGFRSKTSNYTKPMIAGTIQRADSSTPLTESAAIGTFLSSPVIYYPGHVEFVSQFAHSLDGEFATISGRNSNNVIVDSSAIFANSGTHRDPILFQKASGSDVLPGGVEEYARYEVRARQASDTQFNMFDPQDATSLWTLDAIDPSGSPIAHRAVDIWKYKLGGSANRIVLTADLTFCSANGSAVAYTKRMRCRAVLAMGSNGDWEIDTSGEVLGEVNVGLTDPLAIAGFGIDLDGSSEPVLFLAAAAKSNQATMYCTARVKIEGMRANGPLAHHYNLVTDLTNDYHAWIQNEDITVSTADISAGYVTLSGVNAQGLHDVYREDDRDESFSFDYVRQRVTLGSTFLATLSDTNVIKVRYERP